MSVYNSQRHLRQAVESILHQTWTAYEFLIINDGSTDNSREIVTGFDDTRIRLVDNPANVGLTKSLNHGLELARGELVARQDADDISHPARLEQQVRFLDTHPDVVLLGTQARIVDENGHPVASARGFARPTTNTAIKWCLLFGNAFVHTSVMFRRGAVWKQLEGYDERFTRSQDFELWSRVAATHQVQNLPDVLVDQRRHRDSIAARERELHARLGEDTVSKNLNRFLRLDTVPSEWAALINLLRTGRTVEEPDRLTELIDTVFSRFCTLHAGAAISEEIRPYLADQLGLVAYHSATRNRLASIRALIRACRADPRIVRRGIAGEISILRYLALWLGGELVRRLYRQGSSRRK
jgi:glycosyltransferase involved in cell wall biosynthesis